MYECSVQSHKTITKVLWIPLKQLQGLLGILHSISFLVACEQSRFPICEHFFVYSNVCEKRYVPFHLRSFILLTLISISSIYVNNIWSNGLNIASSRICSQMATPRILKPLMNSSNRRSRFNIMFVKLLFRIQTNGGSIVLIHFG